MYGMEQSSPRQVGNGNLNRRATWMLLWLNSGQSLVETVGDKHMIFLSFNNG